MAAAVVPIIRGVKPKTSATLDTHVIYCGDDAFEAVMMREDRQKGFFVSFDFTSDALKEIAAFKKRTTERSSR